MFEEKEDCPKCKGKGKLPSWPRPYTPLTKDMIHSINVNAPKCDECGGTGEKE